MSILRVKDHLIHLTMSNNTTIIYTKEKNLSVYIVAYYAFSLIIVGTIFNLLTFIVLCRKKFRDTNERPALHYMRAMAIFDSLMLYGWNLDHYTFTVYGFELIVYTIASCKYVGFFNYFTRQVSAWLRVFISFDRFLSLKYHYRTWFGRSKNVLIIIGSIIGVGTLFNLHIVIFACFYEPNGTMNVNSRLSMMYPYPIWTYVHLGISNFLPFVLMGIFNANAIYHLMNLRRTSTIQNSRIPHRVISITLIITTCLFLIMTIPATVAFGFFGDVAGYTVLYTFDSMSYTYHILSFATYMITWDEFRQEFIRIIIPNYRDHRVTPQNTRPT